MKISVAGEVERANSKREVFTVTARKELEKEYKSRDSVLSGQTIANPKDLGGGIYRPLDSIQDVPALRKERDLYKKNFERGMPVKLAGQTRDALWKKAKRLKDEFVVGMVNEEDMHPVKARSVMTPTGLKVDWVADYDVMRETKSIQRHRNWEKKNGEKVREFKRIMRILEPDDPDIANIERFRPHKRRSK